MNTFCGSQRYNKLLLPIGKVRHVSIYIVPLLLFSLIVLLPNKPNAQIELWGMTSQGGAYDEGTLFNFNVDSSEQTIQHNFEPAHPGYWPQGGVLLSNGKYYGTTYTGGTSGDGTIYVFDPATSFYRTIHQFNGVNGSHPTGQLIEYDNKFYGITEEGGNHDLGVLFELDVIGNSYTILHHFDGTSTDGSWPSGGIIYQSNYIYGVTTYGGTYNYGTVFRYNVINQNYEVYYNFDGTNGRWPKGRLVSSGAFIYGLTSFGGNNNNGVLYALPTSFPTYYALHHFEACTGVNPQGGLIEVSGLYYGLTQRGGNNDDGVIFSYDPSGPSYNVRHHFDLDDDDNGGRPNNSLIYSGGYLFGSANGGQYNFGVLYKFHIASNTQQVIHHCNYTIGTYPNGDLLEVNGHLIGVTFTGGSDDKGTLFDFDTLAGNYQILKNFSLNKGYFPIGDVLDVNGEFYGLTNKGGKNDEGVLFFYDATLNQYKSLHDFHSGTGHYPNGDLIEVNEKLYGLTYDGGNHNSGVLFEYNRLNGVYSVLHHFSGSDGASPRGSVLWSNDKLYGLTSGGGANSQGVIFQYDLVTDTFGVLYSLGGNDGLDAGGSLLQFDGKFFSMTTQGGNHGMGVIFQFNPADSIYTVLHHFSGADGAFPQENLISSNGKFYGMTGQGGNNNKGVLFEYNYMTSTYSTLHHFDGSTGAFPNGNLVEVEGAFYGLTYAGGASNLGVLFEYNSLSSPAYQVLMEFDSTNGAQPLGTLVKRSTCLSVDITPPELILKDISITIDPLGYAVLDVNDLDDGSYDNCGIDTLYTNYDTITCAYGRNVDVVVTAVDFSGNISKDTVTVRLLGPVSSQVVYVDQNAQGLGTGLSWKNAFTNLESWNCPCMTVPDIDTIKVAQGVYSPYTQNENKSFSIPRNIVMIGGYTNEGAFRDTTGLLTILDGNILDTTLADDNMRQVLIIRNQSVGVIIDGFTIRNGYSDGVIDEERRGAGVRCDGIGTLRNVIIENNYSELDGSAIYVNEPDGHPVSLTLKNVTVRSNNVSGLNLIFSHGFGSEVHILKDTSIGD